MDLTAYTGTGSLVTFATFGEAQAAYVDASAQWVQTLGYYNPGDGGGATFISMSRMPAHAGKLMTADKRHWEITGNSLNVRQFGAVGNGREDDSAAIQAALNCPLALALFFPAGKYRAIGLSLMRSCSITGENAELIWDAAGPALDLLQVKASNFSISNMRFRGRKYETVETEVAPHTLLRVLTANLGEVENVRIFDCDFVGGKTGCNVGAVTDVLIERLRAVHCRDYGLTLQRGPRNVVVRGVIAHDIGTYGGIKTAIHGTRRVCERLVISDFVITNCGWLDNDPNYGQEGIDLACGFAKQWVITNGVITDCGGGGVELKVSDVVSDDAEIYEDIVISNIVISLTGNRGAIKLNWNGPPSTISGKRGRRVLITGNVIRHEGADRRPGAGVVLTAWSDVTITNNRFDGARTGVLIQTRGGPDDTSHNLYVGNNIFENVANGIEAFAGTVSKIRITGNDMNTTQKAISFEGNNVLSIEIDQNSITQQPVASKHKPAAAGISLLQQDRKSVTPKTMLIRGNHITMIHGPAVEISGVDLGGRITHNTLSAPKTPLKIGQGNWEIFSNHFANVEGATSVTLLEGVVARQEYNLESFLPVDPNAPDEMDMEGSTEAIVEQMLSEEEVKRLEDRDEQVNGEQGGEVLTGEAAVELSPIVDVELAPVKEAVEPVAGEGDAKLLDVEVAAGLAPVEDVELAPVKEAIEPVDAEDDAKLLDGEVVAELVPVKERIELPPIKEGIEDP